jgi:hypothetical protein
MAVAIPLYFPGTAGPGAGAAASSSTPQVLPMTPPQSPRPRLPLPGRLASLARRIDRIGSHGRIGLVGLAVLAALAGPAGQSAIAPATAATLQLSGPPGAAVSVDGRAVGLLPLAAPLDLPAGVYTLRCELHGHQDLEQTVVLGEPESWLHLRLRPTPLRRSDAVQSSLLFAGLGQWYAGSTWRGWFYFLGEAGGLLTAVAGEVQRSSLRDDYLEYRDSYRTALDDQDIAFWRAEASEAYADMQDMKDLRNLGLVVAGGAWALSLLDAWLLTPTVDLGAGVVPPRARPAEALSTAIDPDGAPSGGPAAAPATGRPGVHAAVTLSF